jgi:hypothetical protein
MEAAAQRSKALMPHKGGGFNVGYPNEEPLREAVNGKRIRPSENCVEIKAILSGVLSARQSLNQLMNLSIDARPSRAAERIAVVFQAIFRQP